MATYNQFRIPEVNSYMAPEMPTYIGPKGPDHVRKIASEIKGRVDVLVAEIRAQELAKAEQTSRHAEALRNLTQQANDRSLEGKAERHLDRYRKKRDRAQKAGDIASAALMDQRVRTLEALLEL
ncbi:hypothetical protein [Nonomuraea candida]|uniref:hypothetical protein n=1 Tax=Nonomuraea candida TaxID=359159 RepID=UPI0005BA1992|nr:hypothetical protein [Nonomuraea candida]